MKKQNREDESLLVEECEAFLTGTLAEHLDERGIVVPVWAWTNLLAHGDPEQITECVSQPGKPRRSAGTGASPGRSLAFEIFDLMDAGCPLEELQSEVLIPLELEMAIIPRSAGGRRVSGSTPSTRPSAASTSASASSRKSAGPASPRSASRRASHPALDGVGQRRQREGTGAQDDVMEVPQVESITKPIRGRVRRRTISSRPVM